MAGNDTLGKIIPTYFAAIATRPFKYAGKFYTPCDLRISPGIFQGFTCPEKCGACCMNFTLDYLPSEVSMHVKKANDLVERTIDFDGRKVKVFTDFQKGVPKRCKHLNEIGRCGLYRESTADGAVGAQPFSCDFELIGFRMPKSFTARNGVTTRLYSRGWAMSKIDDSKGTLCTLTTPMKEHAREVTRRFKVLKTWADHFGISHCVDEIIAWTSTGPHQHELILKNSLQGRKGGFFV